MSTSIIIDKILLTFRKPKLEDAAYLTDLAIRSKSFWPYDSTFINQCRDDLTITTEHISHRSMFVAEFKSQIVGFYAFSKNANSPEMTHLFVDPKNIGHGIGWKLWLHAVEFARNQGWSHFGLDADPFAAEKFYYKVGCYKTGEIESTVVKGRFLPKLRYDIMPFETTFFTQPVFSTEERLSMNSNLKNIHRDLGITEEHLSANQLIFCEEPSLQNLEIVAIDFEGKPFILKKSAAQAWRNMCAAAEIDQIHLKPFSGFRSYLHQKRLIEKHLSNGRPLKDILTHIAIPGFSEHHSGLAVDIYADDNSILEEAFEKTSAFTWLMDNAGKFKFRLSYPRENKFGIIYEPWHWCYTDEK